VKVLWCAACSSFHSPHPQAGKWRACDCGQAQVTWLDPQRGLLEVRADNLDHVRVIGLNNVMLAAAFGGLRGITGSADEHWRETHQEVCAASPGYLFHTDRRDCWALIVAKHESGDITWTQRPPPE
jgi:hypothetical protein